jgi:hypothetical protein
MAGAAAVTGPDEVSFNPVTPIRDMDEALLRLAVFGAALLAVSIRECTMTMTEPQPGCLPTEVAGRFLSEARAIADAVVLEAQRLRAEGKS